MLISRNLDDQTFEEIVRLAMGRLPWLCPQWTDHNAHDPGVTLLELMAWYKEMQQYHMNQFTEEMEQKLLKLVGVLQQPARGAVCTVEVSPGEPGRLALARLMNQEEIAFELLESIPELRPKLTRVCVWQQNRMVDVQEMLGGGKLTFQPFTFGGCTDTELFLGFSQVPPGELRLWFEVEPPGGVTRNPFDQAGEPPRRLEWELVGFGPTTPVLDETHALSVSGYVALEVPEHWPEHEPQGLHWLRIHLVSRGCEENVRLTGIFVGRYWAAQQETWAKSHRFSVAPKTDQQILLPDAMARDAQLAVFLRGPSGWSQTAQYVDERAPEGRQVLLDAIGAADDGDDNLMVVCLDPVRCNELLFSASGRPGETLRLNLGGRTVLSEQFTLLCDTLDRDGQVRPMFWRCVQELYGCGPRERVFTYDATRETITFGDGLHGAVVPLGNRAILITDMILSYCGGGNIPASAGLVYGTDGAPARNGAASGGTYGETVEEAAERFLRAVSVTSKCVSAQDFERLARATPGLRVAAAKALPGHDPSSPTTGRLPAVVTVVVLPDSETERPLPDQNFLDAVQRQLERHRPVCVRVIAAAPCYAEIAVTAKLWVREGQHQEAARLLLTEYLSARGAGIGGLIRKDTIAAMLQQLPGVLQVKQLELRATGANCFSTTAGDIRIPPNAAPCLRELSLETAR